MSGNGLHWITQLPGPPDRPDNAHKGTFGTVIVVGGSATMLGAPALCATAALRGGAGLVKLAADPQWLPTLLTIQPSATGMLLSQLAELQAKAGLVLAVGPGLGDAPAASAQVNQLLTTQHSLVLDADGLNCLADLRQHGRLKATLPRQLPWIVTPHPGEFRTLAKAFFVEGDPTDSKQRPAAAAALSQRLGAVVVLKGQHTIVAQGDQVYRNETGNPALATAGSGDVLTGLTAALLAQGMQPFEAACLATHVHGDAADDWANHHGRAGMLAFDLAHALPDALERVRQR